MKNYEKKKMKTKISRKAYFKRV